MTNLEKDLNSLFMNLPTWLRLLFLVIPGFMINDAIKKALQEKIDTDVLPAYPGAEKIEVSAVRYNKLTGAVDVDIAVWLKEKPKRRVDTKA